MLDRQLKLFHKHLRQWYVSHGRKNLPWRLTRDSYAIYVSEIMLQQTQVKTVLERFYFPFLKKFPSLSSLASAKEKDVLSVWQGLGYYNRAINLHAAARKCGDKLPETIDDLLALPGIGRNTAHAIAAFAFHQPVAVMEANVRRVLSRIFTLSQPKEADLWDKASQLLDKKNPFDYNQAMMDIGALVCRKKSPLCHLCPAEIICGGKNNPELYPAAKPKKKIHVRKKKIIVLLHDDKVRLTKRKTRFLNGLYHFTEEEPKVDHITVEGYRYTLSEATPIGYITQQYSHFTLEAQVLCICTHTSSARNWYKLNEVRKLPVSMAEHKVIDMICALQD